MTTLLITTEWERGEPDFRRLDMIVHPAKQRIRVKFELLGERGIGSRYTWNMEARYDGGNEQRLRDEFRRSTWWDYEIWADSDANPRDIGSVEVIDPWGILKWLCPDQDLTELFNEKNRLNDKPLRLPAAHSG